MVPFKTSPRLFIVAGLAALAMPVATASAASGDSVYRAELAAPTESATVIAAGVAWRCAGTTCVAGNSSSRPIIVCKKLVRETGALTSFAVKGEDMAADKLARCNG